MEVGNAVCETLDGGTLTGSSQQWAKLATAAQDGVEAPSMLARQVGRQNLLRSCVC